MSTTQQLRDKSEQAHARAAKLQQEREEALAKLRARFDDKCRDANQKAADAQKAMLDAEAADALRDRPDGEAVAEALGLEL